MFIMIPSLEELLTKANEASSPHGVRLSPARHQPSISRSWGRERHEKTYSIHETDLSKVNSFLKEHQKVPIINGRHEDRREI